jgi:hypothetical protein
MSVNSINGSVSVHERHPACERERYKRFQDSPPRNNMPDNSCPRALVRGQQRSLCLIEPKNWWRAIQHTVTAGDNSRPR